MYSRFFCSLARAAARALTVGSAVLLACGPLGMPPLAGISTVSAADYYWDADGSSSASTGGTGTWDTTSSLWRSGSATGTLLAWPNNTGTPDIAFFGGTAGTVTIADATAITAGGLTFTSNYTLNRAGTGSLTLAGASSPVVNVGASGTATISAGIGGSAGLTKTGSGSLMLSGSNSYSGATTLTTGALRLANSNALGTSSISVTSLTSDQTRVIELAGGITIGNSMTVSSSGLGNAGMLRNISGSNTLTNFSFGNGTGTRIGVEAGSTLRITNNLTDATPSAGQAKRFLGAGTLILDGSNSAAFASGTTVSQTVFLGVSGSNGGTVALGNDFALGGSTIQFDANATLRSSSTNARSIANPVTFGTAASQITLGSADTGNLTLSGTLTLARTGTFAVDNTQTTIAGPIAGSTFGFAKSGTGTLVLAGSNSYSGATTLTTGALRLANSNALGSSSLTVTSATNDFTRTVELVGNITVSRSISVSSVGIDQLGVLRNISGSNTLSDFSFGQAPNGTRIGVEAGSTLRITNNITDATTTTQFKRLMGAGTLILDGSNSAGFAGTGFFYMGLSGTGGATVALGNDFALGASRIQFDANATLRSASAAARSIANPITFTSSATRMTFGSADTGDLTLSGAMTLATTGTIAVHNARTTLSGVIAGSGFGLIKAGAGTLALTNANTFTGPTTVSAGTLLFNGDSSAVTGGVSALGGVLGGTGTIGGAITVGSGGTLSPGASVESLATSAVSFGAGSTFAYEVDSTAALSVGADLLRVAGNLTLAGTVELTFADLGTSPIAFPQGTTFSLINYTGTWNGGFLTLGGSELANNAEFTSGLNTWRISYAAPSGGSNFSSEYAPSSSFVNVVVVPEPDTLAAAVLGGGLLLRHLRKRRRVA